MQRYFSEKKENKELILNENDWYHIKTVMRMKNDEKIEIVYQNCLYICTVDVLNKQAFIYEKIDANINDIDITLIIPYLKEQKMDLIMQKATELGVTKIIPMAMERSVVKFDDKIDKKIERWQKICKEASEQSKRLTIPVVQKFDSFDSLNCLDGVKLVCSTKEKQKNLKFFVQSHKSCAKIILVIGPEGGLSPNEEEKFVSYGFDRVSLGNRIMRVETVPIFLLSVINYVYCLE